MTILAHIYPVHLQSMLPLSVILMITVSSIIMSCSDHQGSDTAPSIIESSIEIEWTHNSNFEPGNKLSATLTLVNNGDESLPSNGWALYFNSLRILDTESFPPEFSVSHINGYFFKLEPTNRFEPLAPGDRVEISYMARHFAIKTTDVPEGFYFVMEDGSIQEVETIKIHPFEGPEQLNRTPNDNIPVPTPQFTYHENERLSTLSRDRINPVTPTPVSVTNSDGRFVFSERTLIAYDEPFKREAVFLQNALHDEFKLSSELLDDNAQEEPDIRIIRSNNGDLADEGYQLDIVPGQITISANMAAGAFYGVQTTRSLLSNRETDEFQLDAVTIEDEPAFPYRGMHLDVARNFQPKESVLRLLDIMALYKLNKFHFHLTDDEGWRLAIDPLPELTEVGGRRGHTETEENYMIPVYGSGPDPAPGASMGSGWFSREEYIEILTYASERHIEVIPEIDVPGHARAAILAMKARASRLIDANEPAIANEYRLDEPEDQSSYRSIQNYTDNVINVCQESTYRFMNLVINELIAMHQEAGTPLTMMHVGGDEVPHGTWEESPACAETMDQIGLDSARDLQGYFFGRIAEKLSDHNITMGGWEEVALTEDDGGFSGINPNFTETTVPYSWNNVWGSGTEDRAYKLANAGYKVVMSHASNFYFDFAYNKHWQEPGFYWASMFTTEAPFSFLPFDLFRNATHNNYGNLLPDDHFNGMTRLNPDARENILGLQGQLWSETVNEPKRMEYMIYPRLLGLAERAWAGQPEWSSLPEQSDFEAAQLTAWNEFANRLGTLELPRLSRLYEDLEYRIPAPGAVIRDRMLHANISLPGITIRYTLDGTEPTPDSPVYTEPVEINGDEAIRVAGFSSSGRSGRSVSIN